MAIQDIYSKFAIAPNLQRHMLTVTKLALFLCDHWQGPPIGKELLTKACLLHDLGNIVKFDLEKYPHFLEEEQGRVEYWKQKQKEIIAKYGT